MIPQSNAGDNKARYRYRDLWLLIFVHLQILAAFDVSKKQKLDTLAVNRTNNFEDIVSSTVITGTGSRINNNPSLLKRAKRKAITNALVLAMIDVANENGEIEYIKPYWNTYYCQTSLTSTEGLYYCNWCKNRWCATCCGIRKAHILNKYYPIISTWKEPHLLTLTLKAVKAKELDSRINQITKFFKRINDRCKKRHQRGKGMKIMGVKSLECNFNATKQTYNPRYHIITPNRQTALYLKQEWKKECNKYSFQAGEKGQDLRRVNNTERDLVEVIKYGAKILSNPDPTHKRKRKKGDMTGLHIYANALHTIYKAFDRHHLFSSFGFKLPEVVEHESTERIVKEFEKWQYSPKLMDWVNNDTGKLLSEYEIDGYLE
ncbi:protein rep [Marinirhabdus gelatinilytica]|uniref:Replication protein n=1 Tax=Marinirhabdus gelatinilytica TaxID=1703343 RepID=A0A370QAQ0_9FLAO|nr:protein rep [Marinirhabdus gelatinilytica]RDK85451.1 hypothetical protein C8D94_103276 [Marinirhabdus gelatinilytica]